jgi:hypothetical protein
MPKIIKSLNRFLHQIRQHRNESLVYFPFRYFLRWHHSLAAESSSMRDQQPWLTFQAIDYLRKHLEPHHRIFEYGGGGSTLFFIARATEVHTVEHNAAWFSVLKQAAPGRSGCWRGRWIPSVSGNLVSKPDIANPTHYASDDPPELGQQFMKYASAIDEWPDSYFDWVIVDGRARPSCLMHSISKVRVGGFLVLDNSDREYYLRHTLEVILKNGFSEEIRASGPSPYGEMFTRTTVWKRLR